MNRVFLPPLDSIWRLTTDWAAPQSVFNRNDNSETLFSSNFSKEFNAYRKIEPPPAYNTSGYGDWSQRFYAWQEAQRAARGTPEFLKGTVIVFDRYHISRSGGNAVTVRLLASPDPLLNPRKQGGKMTGKGRIYLMLAELNTLPEIEHVTDFQAG